MTKPDYTVIFDTPVTRMGVCLVGESVTGIAWLRASVPLRNSRNKLANRVRSMILDYLVEGRPLPKITMTLDGSPFQVRVWRALQQINMGAVLTYGELARRLNTSSRAIGQACRTNPIVLFIPCHRVVSASGLGGYMGKQRRVNIKRWLLDHEKACS